ncbi:MAG: iron ABC transporter permease [Pseudomonadales bacterium]|nr:iron ABC transporter permease [Pseudomonadales bacterium]
MPGKSSRLPPQFVLPIISFLSLIGLLGYLSSGVLDISPLDTLEALRNGALGKEDFRQSQLIVWEIRLPRALTAVLIGALLSIAGALTQGLFRNPLADPGLIGVSSGSALGAALAIFFIGTSLDSTLSHLLLPVMAFSGGCLVTWLVYRIGLNVSGNILVSMLLAGVAINALAAAAIHYISYISDDGLLRNIAFWLMGSLSSASWWDAGVLALVLGFTLCCLPKLSVPLNALLLGESEARHLGFSVDRVRFAVVLLVALSVGSCVAFVGVIGFVGLVVPHCVRMLLGPDHRILLWGCALLGGLFVLLADWLARTLIVPAELPIGIVTAVVGGPFFILLIVTRSREAGL